MSRPKSSTAGWLAAVALAWSVPSFALAQADTRPVVAVFTFTNSSIGTARGEFDGLATGIQDLLITDLASNAKFRLVDRSKMSEILQEQNLVRGGQIDSQTAVRLGRILGAQYAVTGGFMADKSGGAVLTGRTIDIETTQIANPQKITGKADDVLGMIAQLSSKIGAEMTLAPKTGRRVGDAGSGGARVDSASSAPSAKLGSVETFAKVIPAGVVEKTMKTKLDAATMKLYSRALEEIDSGNMEKAVELLRQVKAKYPDFEPARRNLDKILSKGGS